MIWPVWPQMGVIVRRKKITLKWSQTSNVLECRYNKPDEEIQYPRTLVHVAPEDRSEHWKKYCISILYTPLI